MPTEIRSDCGGGDGKGLESWEGMGRQWNGRDERGFTGRHSRALARRYYIRVNTPFYKPTHLIAHSNTKHSNMPLTLMPYDTDRGNDQIHTLVPLFPFPRSNENHPSSLLHFPLDL
uniref:Uncharacterized protein n=1 Tax=Picea glauca TaxID=3330 RepID=A0A117NI51_PICGL|nr:hypothetical protein ABT39_MTgene3891 [Picea glauca]QHR86711.1 hypothetical protein Q903MT_gene715 [Picea sitchensis]